MVQIFKEWEGGFGGQSSAGGSGLGVGVGVVREASVRTPFGWLGWMNGTARRRSVVIIG
jgi:hypothetical protein